MYDICLVSNNDTKCFEVSRDTLSKQHDPECEYMNWKILLVSSINRIRWVFENPWRRLREIGITEGMRFLDVGCNLGFYSFPASSLVGESGLIYALDIDPDCLNWVASKAKRTHRSNIRTINADAQRTGLPDENVEIVFVHLVLHDIKDKPVAIKEFYRVLKAGNKLVIDEENVMSTKEVRNLAEDGGFKFAGCLHKTTQVFRKPSRTRYQHTKNPK
jgi:ubiquinone/menaquinone biosynthesis C-methylase UbiE